MPMIVSPLFWEWFNLWLTQFLKDLYHEIKMVALRGGNSSIPYQHTCTNHGSQSQASGIDITQSASSMNVPQANGGHLPNQINMQSLSTVSLQFVPPPASNPVSHGHNHTHKHDQSYHKHDQSSARFTNSNCMPSSHSHHHYRLLPQSRPVECYHPTGAAGATFMPSSTGGSQATAQPSLRVQPTPPQPSAPPAPQQDMTKTNMSGHNFVAPNQTQPRPQYQNFQYRATQHGTRPNSHPRQQQPFIPGAATTTGPVMYPTLVFQPTPMSMQTYQQPRSGSPGYYQYMGHYIGYNNPQSHTPPYYGYATNSPQLPTANLQTSTAGGRTNPTTMVGPQPSPATPTVATVSLPHTQPPTHMHQSMPGIRQPVPKRSHRLAIIDPVTQQDIFSELYSSDSSLISVESSDRQTPQPEPAPTHSIAEEFSRMVNEAMNQPSLENTIKSNFVPKNVDMHVSSTSNNQPQMNAISSISSINNNVMKSELVNINDNRSPGSDAAVEPSETPVVSAISDSPVIVPKMTMNVKTQKSETNVQSVNVETSKMTVEKAVPTKTIKANTPPESTSKPVPAAAMPAAAVPAVVVPAAVVPAAAVPTAAVPEAAAPAAVAPVASAPVASAPEVTAPEVDEPAAAAPAAAAPAAAAPVASTLAPVAVAPVAPTAVSVPAESTPATVPQPQRIPRERQHKSEEKDKEKHKQHPQEKEIVATAKQNGPVPIAISSVDSFQEAISISTSQYNQHSGADIAKKQSHNKIVNTNPSVPTTDSTPPVVAASAKAEPTKKPHVLAQDHHLTATELLSASIEKVARETQSTDSISERKSSAFEAQAKLTQSISSVCRTQQTEPKMKDITQLKDVNLNNQITDPDTANGNTAQVTEIKEDFNKNEKAVQNTKNSSENVTKMAAAADNEVNVEETESCENGKVETDKVVNVAEETLTNVEEAETNSPEAPEENAADVSATPPQPAVFVPKYKYTDDQWSPLNKSGKKTYDLGLLKQIKEAPLSKNKPNAPLLEACNVIRTAPMQEPMSFTPILRPMNDSLFPTFAKGGSMGGSRNAAPRDAKKNLPTGGKGSVKMAPPGGANSLHKPVIHVSLSLREDVKLKESDSAWKPNRFRKEAMSEEDQKNQEVYKRFRGILNKLTPQKFETLLDKVKHLEINTQKRLEGVIDLIFEKAIDEPNFSEAYAAMCNKLSMLKVPADNDTNPDQCVRVRDFRAMIINKCQNQFETNKADEHVLKLEKEFNDCTDPTKKRELQLMLNEENRRIRMRSVGNIRFIGELYKLKILTCKIMVYCMKHLIEKLEEEKLECLCKLLTTIGEQIENEESSQLDNIFKKMQEIVDRRSNKISSRVKFMLQDVIALRRRKWVGKSVVDSQPKMMDQIQKEAEQQQRHIELMNSGPMGGGGGGGGGFRRDDGGRGKRGGDNRRQNNNFMDNTWKVQRTTFPVDTSKLKAVTQKNLNNIKLAPHQSAWNHGSGTKAQVQASSNSQISLSKNKFHVLENVQTDPTSLRANRDMMPSYHPKGVSVERSTFNSRSDYNVNSGSNRSGSVGVSRSNSEATSTSSPQVAQPPVAEAAAPEPAVPAVPQEPITDEKMKNFVKSTIDLCLINADNNELVHDVKQLFPPKYHAAVVSEILNVILEKAAKEVALVTKSLLHLVSTGTIAAENFLSGIKDTFEFAPDLYLDIPMLYEYLGQLVAPQIEKKHITLVQTFNISESIIAANQGHLLLKAIISNINESMGATFVKNKWQESGLKLNKWMKDDQVQTWIEDNKFEFLETDVNASDESTKKLSPEETQSRLLQLMNTDESCDCIKSWVQDKLGKNSNDDWFMKALIQAICEHALFGTEGRDAPHFSQDRMSKYASLIHEFGESKESREASCLVGIQHLIHRLEHPQGLTLEIFQYLHEQYLISLGGFLAWEKSEKDPEGRGVMMMALTSFFTNIKEADIEDSCSED